MSTHAQIAVRQLDAGMDLGPANKNTALNHLVARSMGRVMAEDDRDEDPGPNPKAPGGPEDDSPTTWHRAKKEEPTEQDQAYVPDDEGEPVHEPEPIVEPAMAKRWRMNPMWVPGSDGLTYNQAALSPERREEIVSAWKKRLGIFNSRTTYIRDEVSGYSTCMTKHYGDAAKHFAFARYERARSLAFDLGSMVASHRCWIDESLPHEYEERIRRMHRIHTLGARRSRLLTLCAKLKLR